MGKAKGLCIAAIATGLMMGCVAAPRPARTGLDVNALPGFHATAASGSKTGLTFTISGAERVDFVQPEPPAPEHPAYGLLRSAAMIFGIGYAVHEMQGTTQVEQANHAQSAHDGTFVAR